MNHPPHRTSALRQQGAALLAAMLTVTVVATIASAALWQQWRTIEVEVAERSRIQSAWILIGALDWSRLILREDSRAGGADHLAEPWAVPLQEARLSTFLAADRNVAQVEDASTDTTNAFLSGRIVDMQSRMNLANVLNGAEISARGLRQLDRLFDRLGLPSAQASQLARQLLAAQSTSSPNAPLMPRSTAQLGWLGLPPSTVAQLQPYVTLLPTRTPVNVNTALPEVLWATVEGIDESSVQKILQQRATRHFPTIAAVRSILGPDIAIDDNEHSIASSYFQVDGRLRLDDIQVQERSLVYRQGVEITTLWRERNNTNTNTTSAAN